MLDIIQIKQISPVYGHDVVNKKFSFHMFEIFFINLMLQNQ